MAAVTQMKPTDREAELAAREAALAEKEVALAEREKAIAASYKPTGKDLLREFIRNPKLTDAHVKEQFGADTFKDVVVKGQRRQATAFITLAKEVGHWQE